MSNASDYCVGFDNDGRPQYRWQTDPKAVQLQRVFDVLDFAEKHGIEIYLGEWSPPRTLGITSPKDPRWSRIVPDFVADLIQKRHYSVIHHYILMNEPNDDWMWRGSEPDFEARPPELSGPVIRTICKPCASSARRKARVPLAHALLPLSWSHSPDDGGVCNGSLELVVILPPKLTPWPSSRNICPRRLTFSTSNFLSIRRQFRNNNLIRVSSVPPPLDVLNLCWRFQANTFF